MISVLSGGMVLYKFRSLAREQDVERAADIILNHRLFAAAPKSFNDPFDCDAPYCFDATVAEKIERAIARIRMENPHVSPEEALRLAPSRFASVETNGVAQYRSLIEERLGVVSLAESIDNPLLWGHYASGHTGISIQFRLTDERHADFFGNALPVTYQKKRPVIKFYHDDSTEKIRKCLLTKSEDWAYEKEWRIISSDRRNQCYETFDPSIVGAIYLGCQFDDAKRELVRGWLAKRGTFPAPRLYQARKSETTYELVFTEIPTGNTA